MLHHVTYHVPAAKLEGSPIKAFMSAMGFQEVEVPDWELQAAGALTVRWFQSGKQKHPVTVHLVGGDRIVNEGQWGEYTEHFDRLALGHMCVAVGRARMNNLKRTSWCVRDSGENDRIWCEFANLRVEVRP
jgi:hypothetical protein